MEWDEPVLLRYDFEVGQTCSPGVVCLGYPRRAEDRFWTCAFQFQGVASAEHDLKDGYVHRVTGHNGLGALVEASNAIRSRLDGLVDVRSQGIPHEFVFPRFLPTSSWYDLYELASKLTASEVAKQPRREKKPDFVEQSSHAEWDQPTLLDTRLKFRSRRTVTVRIGIPTFVQGRGAWSCAFQLRGMEGGSIKRAFGENGLLAIARALDLIRGSLDQIGAAPDKKKGYQLTFPAHIPTEYGLEFHRNLVRRIDGEIRKIDKRHDNREEVRAVRFNEMLAILPPAARM